MTNTLLIHDLNPEQLAPLLPRLGECRVVDANVKAAPCQGCFGCWLKTPGKCVLRDSLQDIGEIKAQSDEVIILSRCCYGGFSPGVKRVLDRSIAISLPFFTYRGGRLHHTLRYRKRPALTVCFYGPITAFERENAQRLTEANRVNSGNRSLRLVFAESPEQIGEVLTI